MTKTKERRVQTFTMLARGSYPPKNALIDWITPSGTEVVRGRWLGGAVWMPEGSSMYVYYTPMSWRLVDADNA